MGIFLEFASHLLAFDLGWIAWFILTNLHWVFAFIMVGYFFSEKKKTMVFFFLIIGVVWAINDLMQIIGWTVYVGAFFGILYISRIALAAFIEDVPYLKTKIMVVLTLHFFLVIIVYNLFMT